jgi:hypothetical protein
MGPKEEQCGHLVGTRAEEEALEEYMSQVAASIDEAVASAALEQQRWNNSRRLSMRRRSNCGGPSKS